MLFSFLRLKWLVHDQNQTGRQILKDALQQLISLAIQSLIDNGSLTVDMPVIKIDRTRDKAHGDFAVNVAMLLAKPARKSPREIAAQIIAVLPESDFVEKVEIAGPGFINFYVSNF